MSNLLASLRDQFRRGDNVDFSLGEGRLPRATLKHANGAELETYLYGAHMTSWKVGNQELFYVSPKTAFEAGKAIRGGIPLVFPQFGTGSMPAHGFARISNWNVIKSEVTSKGEVVLALNLSSSPETEKHWPVAFEAELEIRLSDKLVNIFRVKNNHSSDFAFQNAFHTYFAVQDISHTFVEGLSGKTFLDSTKNRAEGHEGRERIDFSFETDRIYLDAPDTLRIVDEARKKAFTIEKTNMKDAIVWNPWIDRCKAIADLEDEAYKQYVCLEPGNVRTPVVIKAGAKWECSQTLSYT